MKKRFTEEVDCSSVPMYSLVTGGVLLMYLSSALDQIPNVPENGQLRKSYECAYEVVMNQQNFQNTKIVNDNVTQDELLNQLVDVMSVMYKNTTYLKLNYKQMLSNRFKKYEFTPERIKEIQTGQGKKASKDEQKHLLEISVMYDVYQFLNAELIVNLGNDKNIISKDEIDQKNHYLDALKRENCDFVTSNEKLIKLAELSFNNFAEQNCKEKKFEKNSLTPIVKFVDAKTDKVDDGWENYAKAKLLPSDRFGDMDLKKCLLMDLEILKTFVNDLLELKKCGYDIDNLVGQAQKLLIKRMEEETKKAEQQNLPLQQTAGKVTTSENVITKKSRFVPVKMKLKKINENLNSQELSH